MEVDNYNDLAERIDKIMSFKNRSEWISKKQLGEDEYKDG